MVRKVKLLFIKSNSHTNTNISKGIVQNMILLCDDIRILTGNDSTRYFMDSGTKRILLEVSIVLTHKPRHDKQF